MVSSDIFHDFFLTFCARSKKMSNEDLDIPLQNVNALLLLDNAPAYPSESVVCSQDAKV
jgi:hypothetical protein